MKHILSCGLEDTQVLYVGSIKTNRKSCPPWPHTESDLEISSMSVLSLHTVVNSPSNRLCSYRVYRSDVNYTIKGTPHTRTHNNLYANILSPIFTTYMDPHSSLAQTRRLQITIPSITTHNYLFPDKTVNFNRETRRREKYPVFPSSEEGRPIF